jgi:NAD(P)-dependent dehydrogenase (short-subunit alcohol dehydrogenase family)
MTERLEGKRVLVTQADDYMGPAITDMFRKHGADVIQDRSDPTDPDTAARAVSEAGHIDVLIANLAADAQFGVSASGTDAGRDLFAAWPRDEALLRQGSAHGHGWPGAGV